MATTTTNMSLQSWDQVGDIYDHAQLAGNWSKVDQHDHTSGKGKQVPTGGIEDGAVTAVKLASTPLINTAQLVDGSVTSAKINDGTIVVGDLANNAVETTKIKDNAITTNKILDSNVTIAKLESSISGAWTPYTPAITNSTFSLGNGNIVGLSMKVGRTVHVRGYITFGTTTTLSGGTSHISIPYQSESNYRQFGLIRADRSSPANYAFGQFAIEPGTSYGVPLMIAGGTTAWSLFGATTPWTWAATDQISWFATYETAT